MTAGTARAGPDLDSRVTDDDGRPAIEYRWRRWFRIRRTDGPAGVILAVRIPGCLSQVTRHDTQDAAKRHASRIYAGYRNAVRTVTDSDRSED